MIRILLFSSLLLFTVMTTSCSYVTVIRTQELKKVETNINTKIDSLTMVIDSLMKEQRRTQNRTNADIRLILSSMAKNNEAIKARLEETQFRLQRINEKSDSILTKRPEIIQKVVEVPKPDSAQAVVDSAQVLKDNGLEERYMAAKELYQQKNFKEAYGSFKDVYVGHSNKEMAEKALYWLASCFEESGKKEGAIKNYKRLITEFPAGKKVCTTKLKLATLAKSLGKKNLKVEMLKSLMDDTHCAGTNSVMQAEALLK
ncbi:MAG: tetratricopeptide repeat protein [Fibrobacterales bacterium]